MAPPNGVPPSSDSDGYHGGVPNSTDNTQETNANNEESKTVACENCKQNQKDEMALNGEPPNNNIIQKNQNTDEVVKNGQAKKLENKKQIEQMDVEEEAELVSWDSFIRIIYCNVTRFLRIHKNCNFSFIFF